MVVEEKSNNVYSNSHIDTKSGLQCKNLHWHLLVKNKASILYLFTKHIIILVCLH